MQKESRWFLDTEIHVWMLMVRGMAEREHSQIIRNGTVAALWTVKSNCDNHKHIELLIKYIRYNVSFFVQFY